MSALFYHVTGHSGQTYVVRRMDTGDWRCECRAWHRGKGCKHCIAAQQKFIAGWEGSFDFPCRLELEPRPPKANAVKTT